MKELFEPGYAGVLSLEELRYLKKAFKDSPTLRRRWGFKSSRISDEAIRKVALDGVDQALKSPQATLGGPETYLGEKGD